MKHKWLLLTKIQLIGMLGFNKAAKTYDPAVKKRTVGSIAALAVVALLMLFYIVMMAFAFCEQGLGRHLPATAIAIASLITLLFSFLNGCSSLFAMKDYDLVMSLPVKKRDILTSRLLCIYLADLAFAALIVIPCIIVLFVSDGFSLGVLAVSLAGMVVSPVLPIIAAVALSAVYTALTAGFRYKTLLQGIFGMAFFVGVMIASFTVSFTAGAQGQMDMDALFSLFVRGIYPPALLIEMTLAGEVWAIFVFVAASAVLAVLFVLVLAKGYDRIHIALTAKGARVGYRASDIKSGSAFSALVRKEFRRLFTCPAYLLNGLCGTVLLLIAGVALLFFDVRALLTEDPSVPAQMIDGLVYAGVGLLFFFVGTGCPSAAALSLEGSARDQLFVLPVSARRILLAKAFPSFLLNLVAGMFATIVFCARMQADALGWTLVIISVPIACGFTALTGIWLNYKMPKYDWTTETQAIKQSVPGMICALGSMAVGAIVIGVSLFWGPWAVLIADFLCLIAIAMVLLGTKRARLV